MSSLEAQLKDGAYTNFTKGRFQKAQTTFTQLLHLVCSTRTEENEVDALKEICREYLLGIQCQLKRQILEKAKEDAKTQVELAAYFTHCKLQKKHVVLALQVAT